MRTTGAVLALTAMLVLSACGGSTGDSPSAAVSPGDTPTDATSWAGGICTQADELDAAIAALGQGLEVKVTGDGAGLESLKEQLRTQAQAVATEADDLLSVATTPPADASPEVQDAVASLQQSQDALAASVDKLTATAASATSSDGVTGLLSGISAISADLAATTTAASALASSVKALAQTGTDSVKAAFAAAPACADRVG